MISNNHPFYPHQIHRMNLSFHLQKSFPISPSASHCGNRLLTRPYLRGNMWSTVHSFYHLQILPRIAMSHLRQSTSTILHSYFQLLDPRLELCLNDSTTYTGRNPRHNQSLLLALRLQRTFSISPHVFHSYTRLSP